MSGELGSILLGTAGLAALALVAIALTFTRGAITADQARRRSAARLSLVVVVLHIAHAAEEAVTGFPLRFPVLLGLAPWPMSFFVAINLMWLVVWIASVRGLAAGRRRWLFPLWFLALAASMNGLAHPLLAARTGEYFPGLVTSPVLGVAGVLLFRRLLAATRAPIDSLG